jgi:Zn-dependent protease
MQAMNNPVYSAAIWIIPLVIAIVLHEISHGWVANALGDPTAKRLGRLSVNPITHVDPVGTLLVPLGLAIAHLPVFGWAKPVPVVASQLRNPRRDMMIVALAGPAMNLVLALIGALLLAAFLARWHGAAPTGVARFTFYNLFNFIQINVFLAVFNLLPIPPFDGGHVVEGLLPRPLARRYGQLARYAFP